MTKSPEECQALCQKSKKCTGFTWTSNDYVGSAEEHNRCCLKGEKFSSHEKETGIVSGPKFCLGDRNII